MKTSLSLAVATTVLMTFSHAVQACEADGEFIGAVCFTAATYCPDGYLEANGQTVPVMPYQALYSLIGVSYGGTIGQNFTLPNLQGYSPAGQGAGPGLTPAVQYKTRGAESQTLTLAQMPAHTHAATLKATATVNATTNSAASAAPSAVNNQLAAAVPASKLYAPAGSAGTQVPLAGAVTGMPGSTVTLGNTGGNTPIPTLSPQLVLKACIATVGAYPVRPD